MHGCGVNAPHDATKLDRLELGSWRLVKGSGTVRVAACVVGWRVRMIDGVAIVRTVEIAMLMMKGRIVIMPTLVVEILVLTGAMVVIVIVVIAVMIVMIVIGVLVIRERDPYDRTAGLVRVVVVMEREVEVRQNLHSEQPHRARYDRERAAMTTATLHGQPLLRLKGAIRSTRRARNADNSGV